MSRIVLALAVLLPLAVDAQLPPPPARPPAPAPARAEACPHGVAKALCTRCNPKLAPVFKAKGDWCAEHERPESQCVLCHPELAKKGIR